MKSNNFNMDVIALTKKLISFNTINPPGNEAPLGEFIGSILEKNGFKVRYPGFGENRIHVIAEKGVGEKGKPIVLSGHLDTVPLGSINWRYDPLKGIEDGDKLYGRGSSDMKSGLAAMIVAACDVSHDQMPPDGIRLLFTAGEELGCQGVQDLVKNDNGLGEASAVLIGEPTGNTPANGHKGAIYLDAVTRGKTAHSSMPDLGINAIYKAARAISKLEKFRFSIPEDNLLGYPTLNVGRMSGGLNLNSVPDHAEFTIDIRTTSRVDHSELLERLGEELGDDVTLTKNVDLGPVNTGRDDPFVRLVSGICKEAGVDKPEPVSLPYLTDGSVLQKYYSQVPTIIIGPGQAEMAHKTDEFCYISKIRQAVTIYRNIIINWKI